MTLEEAYFISQIIAAVAVVLSLIYLALQVQVNTKAVRLSTGHAISREARAIFSAGAQNESLADVILRGRQSVDNLQDGERFRYYLMVHDMFFAYQDAFLQMRSGVLEQRYWSAMLVTMKTIMGEPGPRAYWHTRMAWYAPEFRDFLEREVMNRPEKFNAVGVDVVETEN